MAKLFANDTIGAGYAEQLKKEHDGSKWGSTGARYSGGIVVDVLASRPYIQTAFDYGCGKGTLAQAFPELEWCEYDPGIPGKDVKPNEFKQFDLVTCTDVLEHVEPHLVVDVLEELGRFTGKVLVLDIACYPTGKTFAEGPYKGEDLHLVVQPPEWWYEVTDATGLQLFEYRSVKKLSKGKYKERAVFIYERV